jgi:dihydroorotase
MILLVGVTIVSSLGKSEMPCSIWCEGDRVTKIVPGAITPDEGFSGAIIDCSGLFVTAGLIDMHVHFREPGQEWKETIETGGRAALTGGFTSVCCMPNTVPVNDSKEITEYIVHKARDARQARVFPLGAISRGLHGKGLAPFSDLRNAGCVGFSDDGEPVWHSGIMRSALEWARELDVPLCCHEEDKTLHEGGVMNESSLSVKMGLLGMPKAAEDIMVARDIELARLTGGHLHVCHVSTARTVELIRRAKNDGVSVTGEASAHHLHLTQECVVGYKTEFKMSPPLREEEDVQALREGVSDGTIDVIASDHAPHEHDAKVVEFSKAANGILGLETTLPLCLELVEQGAFSLSRMVDALTVRPASICRLPSPRTVEVGGLADLTVIDPSLSWTYSSEECASKSRNSPFFGRSMKGRALASIVQGELRYTILGNRLQGISR